MHIKCVHKGVQANAIFGGQADGWFHSNTVCVMGSKVIVTAADPN